MSARTKRIMEATKGLGQSDVKGSTKDYIYILTVGLPQIGHTNLKFMLVRTSLVWLRPIQNYYVKIPPIR